MYFLQTARLGFRHWTAADLPLTEALWTDPDVMAHMGGAMTPQAAAERLLLEMDHQRRYGYQYWPIFSLETGEHAGCAGLQPFHGQTDVLMIGVHLARPFWSGRLGEEAARAVITYAWEHTGAVALTAGHGRENVHSKALVERLGFRYTHHEVWGPHKSLNPHYQLDRR